MFLNEFLKKVNTTRDTVYFYIDKELMKPQKKSGRYRFSSQDVTDFESIHQLRTVGFSISKIQRLVEQRSVSKGTPEHYKLGLGLIRDEVKQIDEKIAILQQQRKILACNEQELQRRLKGSDADVKND